ncbi:MAG: diaminopimelate epimerase [Acidobacteriales bacterium]|nr:diaminopimelate epimerase [Terriglobales bacterium]
MSTLIPFVKASACGNDFLIVHLRFAEWDLSSISRSLCDRHDGVGADGVEWLLQTEDADIAARLFNADGSEAEISGNGTRCVAAYICSIRPATEITIHTGAGVKKCVLQSKDENDFDFETAMGEPRVEQEMLLRLRGAGIRGIPVSLGNPHFVIPVEQIPENWQAQAAEIQASGAFPAGVNVEYVVVRDDNDIEARFFERGAGETLSSGTGSCASAVAGIASGGAQSPVRVHTPGGTQTVRWDDQVYLRGTARLICRGEFWAR